MIIWRMLTTRPPGGVRLVDVLVVILILVAGILFSDYVWDSTWTLLFVPLAFASILATQAKIR